MEDKIKIIERGKDIDDLYKGAKIAMFDEKNVEYFVRYEHITHGYDSAITICLNENIIKERQTCFYSDDSKDHVTVVNEITEKDTNYQKYKSMLEELTK
jgi:hypothetical protein